MNGDLMSSFVTVRISSDENRITGHSEFALEREFELHDGNPRFTAQEFEKALDKAKSAMAVEIAALRGDVREVKKPAVPKLDLDRALELFKNIDTGPTVPVTVNLGWFNWVVAYGEALVNAARRNSGD